ncbi:MAG TPA: hypothetical protein VKH81_18315 [Candidatus Angelobacter sp.]|nr:hypothetical protein [Candidatus Angelobacter sp.]
MEKLRLSWPKIIGLLTLVTFGALSQAQSGFAVRGQSKAGEQDSPQAASSPADDISGMYSFLKEGEFIQINLDENRVTGYISRLGDSDSDRGVFLDQFFDKASIKDHDVSFTTKPLHGVWFEFKGKYERGPVKTKAEDGYYLLRGTLKEYSTGDNKSTVSRSRQVEFKMLGQPDDSNQAPPNKNKKSKD